MAKSTTKSMIALFINLNIPSVAKVKGRSKRLTIGFTKYEAIAKEMPVITKPVIGFVKIRPDAIREAMKRLTVSMTKILNILFI